MYRSPKRRGLYRKEPIYIYTYIAEEAEEPGRGPARGRLTSTVSDITYFINSDRLPEGGCLHRTDEAYIYTYIAEEEEEEPDR